jgi:predicted NBD/HSP70 family sugar kinase
MDLSERIPGRNAKEIYALIRQQGTASKQQLQEKSKLTGSTLTRVLDELLALGLVEAGGFGQSTGGRRPILYRTRPDYAYVFGLDISRMTSRLLLCDLHLNKIDARHWQMNEDMTPERMVDEVAVSVAQMMDKHGIDQDSVLGLGIGAVGPLDRFQGIILEPLYFPASGWKNVPICRNLQERLGFPVMLENGVNTALLGEYWADTGSDHEHLLYIHVGVGIRSAMMSNGRIVYGAVDMEGAVGQMIIHFSGRPPRDEKGNYGSLESYVSIYALEQEARSRLKQGRSSVLTKMARRPEEVTFPLMMKALAEGDELVKEIYTQAATYFGIGLANMLNILYPEKVILGGPVIAGHELFFQVACEVANAKTYYYPAYEAVFSKGLLGEDALAVGAAVMVINRLTES